MRNDDNRPNRRGNVMVVGLTFGVMLGFSALSVDLALVRLADTQHQASVDAAALSAASELDGTTTGITAARNRAIAVAAMNNVMGTGVALASSDIEFGTWDGGAWTLYTGGAADSVNAVRINDTPPQVGSVLGAVAFGIAGYDIDSRAMAARPLGGGVATTSNCFLPFAVPDCHVTSTAPGTNPPPFRFIFQGATVDNIAYATLTQPASQSSIAAQMSNGCNNGTLTVSTPSDPQYIYPNNGLMQPLLVGVANILNDNTSVNTGTWDTSMYGPMPLRIGTATTANLITNSAVSLIPYKWTNTWEGPVALVDAGTDCSNIHFNANPLEVTGIAWGVVYDVRNSGPAGAKNIYMQLDLINEHQIWGEVDPNGTGNVVSYGESNLVSW